MFYIQFGGILLKTKRSVFILAALVLSAALVSGVLLYNGIIWFVYPEHKGYEVKGIDVARYQGDIDWEIISSQSIKFAFIKATEGSSYSDPTFDVNIIESRNNGIYSSAYHFFSAESSGKTQAENFIKIVSPYIIDLPPVLDFEIPKTVNDKENIVKEAQVFLRTVEKFFGITPIIYTTYESYSAFLASDFYEYPLWFRDLLREPKIEGERDWLFWQYSNRGRINGIDKKQKYVDLNVFNGTADEFEAYVRELSTRLFTE